MRCEHTTIHNPRTGQQGICSRCALPVIFNGSRWVWLHGLSPREQKALTTDLTLRRITGQEA